MFLVEEQRFGKKLLNTLVVFAFLLVVEELASSVQSRRTRTRVLTSTPALFWFFCIAESHVGGSKVMLGSMDLLLNIPYQTHS